MTALAISIYLFSALLFIASIFLAKKGPFYILFLIFCAFLGSAIIVNPILLLTNTITPAELGSGYIFLNRDLSIATAIHVLCICFGLLVGLNIFNDSLLYKYTLIENIAINRKSTNKDIFWALISIGFISNIIFFSLFGLKDALASSAAIRSNAYEGDTQYLFLKTLSYLALYASCFIPTLVKEGGNRLCILLYTTLVILSYLNSISRELILVYLLAPFAIAYIYKGGLTISFAIRASIIITAGVLVLTYGRVFGQVVAAFFSDNTIIIDNRDLSIPSVLLRFLNDQEYLIFTIDAGIKNFFSRGPEIPTDVLLSPFGIFPASFYNAIGLEFLSYHNIKTPLSCYNSSFFYVHDCQVPTRLSGYSAYAFPFGGGFIYGLLASFIYCFLANMWIRLAATSPQNLWIPYFIWSIFLSVNSFVPNGISRAITVSIIIYILLKIRKPQPSRRVEST